MSRQNGSDQKLYAAFLQPRLKAAATRQAIAATFTLDLDMGPVVYLDPTGAQTVNCPTEGGRFIFFINHGSTNNADLTIKNSAGTTLCTLSQSEMAIIIDDGVRTLGGVLKQT
jgi:hypothetical protein